MNSNPNRDRTDPDDDMYKPAYDTRTWTNGKTGEEYFEIAEIDNPDAWIRSTVTQPSNRV